ncbi:MAG: hypothetical protein KF803_02595 [Cyclobacteriaceae bacterium]|nr:hypothetical protein [Cyclobacteriaceae bacterium]
MKETKEKVKGWFAKAGQSVADKLNEWINPFSHAAKKKGLIAMGILTSMVCVMLVIRSLQSNETSPSLKVEQITTPADIHPKENAVTTDPERSIMEQYNRMIRFKELVEKLSSSRDHLKLDSLMKAHPGLRDSLNEFIKHYY